MSAGAEIIERASDALTELYRIDKWKNFIIRNDQHYYRFRAGVVELFNRQEKDVISNLDNFKSIKADFLVEIEEIRQANDDIFDIRKWRLIFEEFGQLLLPEVVQDRGEKELGQLMIGVEFDVENPRVVEFLNTKVRKFSLEVNDTTLDDLYKTLTAGVKEGEGIPALRKRVKAVFTEATTSRADNIARTEVIGSSNFGAHEAYIQSNVVESEEWLATKDDRVRESHARIDGETKPLESKFSNGLRYPGDPNGPPEEVCRCRCTILPIVAKE